MCEYVLAEEFVAQMSQSVRVEIEVGLVDLVDVACEYDLGAFAGTCDYGLDLVRGEVL